MPLSQFAGGIQEGSQALCADCVGAKFLLGHQGILDSMSPELPFYGAYFPAWLISATLGVLGSILVRSILIRLGVDEGIPLRTLVYLALACLIAFAVSASLFGR